MRAVVTPEAGAAPEVREVPEPQAAPGRALVRLLAAALNPVDLAIGAGRFYMPVPEAPRVAGVEAVGEVVASAVHAPGTRVWSLEATGRFAEVFSAADDALVPVPDGLDAAMAAAIGVAGLAGWMPVRDRGALVPGETVAVLGAGGIVGQVAIQAALLGGAGRVVALARSDEGLARARVLGAHAVVPLGATDPGAALRAAAPDGVDLIVDTLWGAPLAACLPALRHGGRVVQVGSAAGQSAELVAGPLRGGRIDIRGFSVFSEAHRDIAAAYAALAAAVAGGEVRMDVERVPLRDAPAAWARQASGTRGAKLVLVP
ncbi:MAG: zinc-binding dehydrogenase [Thermoleophilia bacterium]|nr:zinc-binding dehydrogenase [Thermoleophilia bacterium]